MRSTSSQTSLPREAEACTRLRRPVVVLKWKRKNSRPLLRKLNQLLNKKRLRLLVLRWKLLESDKKLIDVSQRKKRNSKTQGMLYTCFQCKSSFVFIFNIRQNFRLFQTETFAVDKSNVAQMIISIFRI